MISVGRGLAPAEKSNRARGGEIHKAQKSYPYVVTQYWNLWIPSIEFYQVFNIIELLATAVANHDRKLFVDGVYDELLKDADVLDHCLNNNSAPFAKWEVERYNNLLVDLNIKF